jgi:hypothetical protein
VESDPDEVTNSPEVSDEELAKLAQRGDTGSLNKLFSKHWSALENRARWLYADDWEMLRQEAFLVATTTMVGPPVEGVHTLRNAVHFIGKNDRFCKVSGMRTSRRLRSGVHRDN